MVLNTGLVYGGGKRQTNPWGLAFAPLLELVDFEDNLDKDAEQQRMKQAANSHAHQRLCFERRERGAEIH